MTASEYAQYLGRTVRDANGRTDLLKAARPFLEDPDYELTLGQVFADEGDDQSTLLKHDEQARKFLKIDRAASDSDSFIYHAPKPVQSVRYGRRGISLAPDEPLLVQGAGTLSSLGSVVTGVGTQFTTDFVAGDWLRSERQTRRVLVVSSATRLEIDSAFSSDLTQVKFERLRRPVFPGTGTISTVAGSNTTVEQTGGADFDTFFVAGDLLRTTGVPPLLRRVVRVTSQVRLEVDQPFPPAFIAVGFEKLGKLEEDDGFPYVARPAEEQAGSGETVMDFAADFGALLCLGAASQIMDDGPRSTLVGPPLRKAYQVFRNWNLDRRRVNEWRMLVGGGAVSEKHGHPDSLEVGVDPVLLRPTERFDELAAAGERTANMLGWVPLFRRWLDVARRPEVNAASAESLRPGDPPVRELTRALAFLFGLPDVT
jgi:hypothetical protein